MHRGLTGMLRNSEHPLYVSKWVSMQKFIGKFFPYLAWLPFPSVSCLESCTCTTVSGKNAKCTEADPECYETLHIHSMCQNGCPRKNSSGHLCPNSRGLRSRPCRALNRARARRCRARTQNAPRPIQNATKLCTSILCVKMGVHAKIHREILSLTRVPSVPVRGVP